MRDGGCERLVSVRTCTPWSYRKPQGNPRRSGSGRHAGGPREERATPITCAAKSPARQSHQHVAVWHNARKGRRCTARNGHVGSAR